MIVLRTLGECIVEVDGEPLGPDADTAFAGLILLAAERGRRLSRRHVAELFWPGVPESRARHSLRQLLYRLRAYDIELDAGREHIRLAPELIVPTFAAEPTLARLREAQGAGTLVIGPCLPGYAPTFSVAFTEWLDNHRSVVEAQVRRALLQAAHEHQLRGEWRAADAMARECLRIDPLNEEATLKRAECVAMMGGKAEALAILDRYNAEMGERGAEVTLPATILRRRISEQLPTRRYAIPSDRCFVGRESMMALLTLPLLRARSRDGSAHLLWGAPGIGKTRVAQELSAVAAVQGLRLVRVQCEESDTRHPMSAWVDAVPQLLRLPGALGVSPDAMPFLKRLTEFDPTLREPSPEARDPQYLAGRIRQSIVDLVDAVAGEAPLLLLFEDVHWMDGASWAALRVLLEWVGGKPVLMLMTSRRPHATPAPPQRELPQLEVHEVEALSAAAASQLVHAIAADFGGPMPEGAEAWCLEVGEGNPLFLRELAVDCLVEGKPRAVPPSVQTLLDARIARLRPRARQVLQASAILGEHATVERLDAVLEMPTYELVGALDELTEAGLVSVVGPSVRPRHELVAVRIAAATSDGSKRLLHRRSAQTLERAVEHGASLDVMWACTQHWQTSGEGNRGVRLIQAAIGQLIEVGLPAEAITVCEQGLSYCDSEDAVFDLERRRAGALGVLGRWFEASHVFAGLIEQERDKVALDRWARDVNSALQAELFANGFEPSVVQRAIELASDLRLPRGVRLESAALALKLVTNTGERALADQLWNSLRGLIADGPADEARLHVLAMLYHISFGHIDNGAVAAGKVLESIREGHFPDDEIAALINLAEAARVYGDLSAAVAHAGEAFERALRASAVFLAFRAADKLAVLAIERRDLADAEVWVARAQEWASHCHDADTRFSLADTLARLLLLRGETTAACVIAMANLHEFRQLHIAAGHPHRTHLTTALETQLACDAGPVDSGMVATLGRLHDAFKGHMRHDRTALVYFRALARNGEHGRALTELHDYLQNSRRGPSAGEEQFTVLRRRLEREIADATP